LQVPETLGLVGDTAGNFLQVARYIGQFDAEAADPARKLLDQSFAIGGQRIGVVRLYWLRERHCRIPPDQYAIGNLWP
jgi:hypothetical protein